MELHRSTLPIKLAQTGHPFPIHQDNPFYIHENRRFIDTLVHLEDICHENGEICFLAGSHKNGFPEHNTQLEDGAASTPRLPTDEYHLEDSVPVPDKVGDVVQFCINTVHGPCINKTKKPFRLVRIGYRGPDNKQLVEQSVGRPKLMVQGYRLRQEGMELLSIAVPVTQTTGVITE